MSDNPTLRPLDLQPIQHEGHQMWLLRDPLELSDMQLVLAPPLAQLLYFCDGSMNAGEIQSALSEQLGVPVDDAIVADTLHQLDDAYLLANERSRQAMREQLAEYSVQESRKPSIAGLGYPADPYELTSQFLAYGDKDDLSAWSPWMGRGVISPHIDYQRGGPVYSQVWQRAELAVKQAELVIVFGTDHIGSDGSITLTSLPYATPFGVLPSDPILVSALAEAIGEDAFTEELHHRNEHSVELSANWVHYMNDRQPTPMVPILCGSFHGLIQQGLHPDEDQKIESFITTLREQTAGKRVLAVASVDLAHVGPNFGDDFAMDAGRRENLILEDRVLIDTIKAGDSSGFFRELSEAEDRNRVCGTSSIYLLLRFLGQTSGQLIAYDHCPADQQNASLVSICGLLLE